MYDVEEGPPSALSAVGEALREPDVPLIGPDLATRYSPGPSNKSSHHDDDAAQQLAELKALNEKHYQIISLLKNRFDILVDNSKGASILLKKVLDDWKSLYPPGTRHKHSVEGLLLKILPCGTDFMGLNVAGIGSSGNDSDESIEYQKDSLQERHIMVTGMLEKWAKALNDLRYAREVAASERDLTWKPIVLPQGRPIEGPSDCLWPDNWESPLNQRQSSHTWNFFAVVPPQDNQESSAFHVQEILPFPTGVVGTEPSTPETHLAHPPIHGVICALRVELFQKLVSFHDLATIVSMSSDDFRCEISDVQFFKHHYGPWAGPWNSVFRSGYRPRRRQDEESFTTVLTTHSYYMKLFKFKTVDPAGSETEKDKGRTNTSFGSKFSASGIQLERDQLSVEDASGKRHLLLEHRYSTLITMAPHSCPIGNFRLLSIEDTVEHRFYRPPNPIWRSDKEDTGIHPAGLLTGIAVFQVRIYWAIDLWASGWKATLNQLSATFSVTPKSIENEQELEDLMYDPDLKKTRTYFKVLQILRIFSDIVETAGVEFQSFSDKCMAESDYNMPHDRFPEEQLVINHNWAVVKAFHKERTNKLLFQMASMKKEIEGLRAGLFNAQSVKEAQKTRELNKIMMVFTIVTILFLPPTFVATFFGVEVFHAASNTQTRKIFWTVFSVVTVTTFFTSLGAILGLLTPASWTRLGNALPKLSRSPYNLRVEQQEPEKASSIWRRLSSLLGRHGMGDRTPEQDSELA